jgi:hypothetical protein
MPGSDQVPAGMHCRTHSPIDKNGAGREMEQLESKSRLPNSSIAGMLDRTGRRFWRPVRSDTPSAGTSPCGRPTTRLVDARPRRGQPAPGREGPGDYAREPADQDPDARHQDRAVGVVVERSGGQLVGQHDILVGRAPGGPREATSRPNVMT